MREAEIKTALTHHLAASAADPSESFYFLEEVRLNGGEVRADLVRVEDMHCYEIKSEVDSLKRLVGQGSRYGRVFDQVTLVTAERHLRQALTMLPSWWGVLVIPSEAGKAFKQVRKASLNQRHEPDVLVTLLKRDEALEILTQYGYSRGFKSKSLYLIQAKITELLTIEELRDSVRSSLINRASLDD